MNIRRFSGYTGLVAAALIACVACTGLTGCGHVANQWVEDGPATKESWETPTSRDILEKCPPCEQRHRQGETLYASAERGAVLHGPLYMEDPFADKGTGREGLNKYYVGWEDYVAMPYCFARYTLNWLLSPASMVVTPPWTKMESDGEISKQLLGYDHDAERLDCSQPKTESAKPAQPAQPAQPEPKNEQPAEPPKM
jgi:hypothetical protein